ncbi:MAG: endonuclease III domain-containing protein [Thermoplasmata archaeon]|nr:endonuclease III domain-containing protein [Thermoplasmata archaeon]
MRDRAPLSIYETLLDHYGEQHWWPAETPFEVIVGAVLTQRTSWTNVEMAIENLKRAGMMNVDAIAGSDLDTLREMVRPSGFYNVKAERIRNLSRYLRDNHGGLDEFFAQDLSDMRRELLDLAGIGKETADSIILYAADKPMIVVDAYTKRLCQRLPFPVKTLSYDHIQSYFQDSLPPNVSLYKEFHALIVIHGKERCRTKPLCTDCPLARLCRYPGSEEKEKGKKNKNGLVDHLCVAAGRTHDLDGSFRCGQFDGRSAFVTGGRERRRPFSRRHGHRSH